MNGYNQVKNINYGYLNGFYKVDMLLSIVWLPSTWIYFNFMECHIASIAYYLKNSKTVK